MDYIKIQDDLIQVAQNAGAILKKAFRHSFGIHQKELVGDLVTDADLASETCILSCLQTKYPSIPLLSEEKGLSNRSDSPFMWVIDPLDGTVNFAHGLAQFAISMALVKEGIPQVGVIYNPISCELYTAIKNRGSFYNGQPIVVSKTVLLQNALLASGFPYDRRTNVNNNYKEFIHLTDMTQGVRRMGAASLDLALVAQGVFDGYWEQGLKPWDMAAGILLVEEARGVCTQYNQQPFDIFQDQILASNGFLHHEIAHALENCTSF